MFEEFRYYEDRVCTPVWFSKCDKVKYIPIQIYYYRPNPKSVVHTIAHEEWFNKADEYLLEYFKDDDELYNVVKENIERNNNKYIIWKKSN